MRRLPDELLAYPVLIVALPSTGSGFFLNTGKAIFLITAGHVLIDPKTGSLHNQLAALGSPSKDPAETQTNNMRLDLGALRLSKDLRSDPVKDIAVVRIGAVESKILQPIPGVVMVDGTRGGIVTVAMDLVRLYADVLESNETYIFGYPSSLGIPQTPQIDYMRPLLRRGIVAGKNDARRIIIIDCPVYPGNSGGPVLEVEQDSVTHYWCRIIGVVLEFVPSLQNGVMANSGYTVAASMDDVMALVNMF